MSVTAHKIRQTFHVQYDMTLGDGLITDFLETEAGDKITTESLLPIEVEQFGDNVVKIRAHKIGRNTFIATNRRITGG